MSSCGSRVKLGGMVTELLAFVGVCLVVICTPGPDTALTIRIAIAGGRRSGVLTAAGVASGQLVWTIAAATGLAGLVAASGTALHVIKLAGAAYLIFLGVQSLWAAVRGVVHQWPVDPRRARSASVRSFRQGLLNDLANPKMAAFFLSLLPQFVPNGQASWAGFVLLGALFCALTFLWLTGYALLLDRARQFFGRQRVRRTLDAISGGVLVGFGVRLGTARP